MTQFVPPNDHPSWGSPKEVLFLGQYGKKYNNGPSNIARNIKLDEENPAKIEEVIEASRLICNPLNRYEPCFSQITTKIVQNAYPRKIFKERNDGSKIFFIVLSKPLQPTNNIIVRINTSSAEEITHRRGRWYLIAGRPSSASRARGVKEFNNRTVVTWIDDLVVLHNMDIIKVVTEGSEEVDDQVLMNIHGHLVMAPAVSFYISGLEPEVPTAEALEREMIKALSECDFISEPENDENSTNDSEVVEVLDSNDSTPEES